MISSMTAYGQVEKKIDQNKINCEIRTVNHRYLEIAIKLPEKFKMLEQEIHNCIAKKIKRGKVSFSLKYEKDTSTGLNINREYLGKLVYLVETISSTLKHPAKVDPLVLLGWQGVLEDDRSGLENIRDKLLILVDETLNTVIMTRKREGEKTQKLILIRCQKIREIIIKIRKSMPTIIDDLCNALRLNAQKLDVKINEDRFEQEVLLLANKMDISEEIERVYMHIEETIRVMGQEEPVGRRLDFLMQELNREANTIGSKSSNINTSNFSIDLKVLIEQMREHIQNIE